MKLKLILEEITKDELKRIGKSFVNGVSMGDYDKVSNWLSNVSTTGKSPSGMKVQFDLIKGLKDSFERYEKDKAWAVGDLYLKTVTEKADWTFKRLGTDGIDSLLDALMKSGKAKEDKLTFGQNEYVNDSLMSEKRFKETSAKVNEFLQSFTGFHKKALSGGVSVHFKTPTKMKSKAVYRESLDQIWISETYTREIDSDRYGSLAYIIVHELGHRYEKKVGNLSWFNYSSWNTTRYSMTDTFHAGEQFAELFALSFWGTSKYPEYKDKINKFIEKMK